MSFYRPSSLCETLSVFYTPQGIGWLTGFPEHRLAHLHTVNVSDLSNQVLPSTPGPWDVGRGRKLSGQAAGQGFGEQTTGVAPVHTARRGCQRCESARTAGLAGWNGSAMSVPAQASCPVFSREHRDLAALCPKRIVESKWTAALGCGCFNVMPSPAVYRCGHVSLSASTPARRGLLCHLLEQAGLRSKEAAGTGGGSFLSVTV